MSNHYMKATIKEVDKLNENITSFVSACEKSSEYHDINPYDVYRRVASPLSFSFQQSFQASLGQSKKFNFQSFQNTLKLRTSNKLSYDVARLLFYTHLIEAYIASMSTFSTLREQLDENMGNDLKRAIKIMSQDADLKKLVIRSMAIDTHAREEEPYAEATMTGATFNAAKNHDELAPRRYKESTTLELKVDVWLFVYDDLLNYVFDDIARMDTLRNIANKYMIYGTGKYMTYGTGRGIRINPNTKSAIFLKRSWKLPKNINMMSIFSPNINPVEIYEMYVQKLGMMGCPHKRKALFETIERLSKYFEMAKEQVVLMDNADYRSDMNAVTEIFENKDEVEKISVGLVTLCMNLLFHNHDSYNWHVPHANGNNIRFENKILKYELLNSEFETLQRAISVTQGYVLERSTSRYLNRDLY